MNSGFSRVDERFDRSDQRLEDVIDIAHRIYDEHGRRLTDIEAQLTSDARA